MKSSRPALLIALATVLTLATALILALAARAAEEVSGLSLAAAEPVFPTKITATGRLYPQISARIGPRLSGHIVEFGKDDAGRMLDAGMTVKAGQFLFQLNQTTFKNNLAIAEATLASAQAALDNLTAPAREERLAQLDAVLAELKTRLADRQRDEDRFRRLVEQDKTMPVRRLEEVVTEVASIKALMIAAEARLREARNGPTKTEIAVAAARVKEAQATMKIAEDELRDTTVRAPFAGLITRRFKSPGDYITNVPPTEVVELVTADTLEAELRLPEAYFTAIQAGKTQVLLRSPLLKEAASFPITRIISDIDPVRGTFPVRVVVAPEQRGGLVPGAFISADIILDTSAAGVIIPLRAVARSADKAAVFVAESGKMVRRNVELGDRLTEGVVVKSGLSPGQKVIVGPIEAVKDGDELPSHLREK